MTGYRIDANASFRLLFRAGNVPAEDDVVAEYGACNYAGCGIGFQIKRELHDGLGLA
jgi:hypothetical protein